MQNNEFHASEFDPVKHSVAARIELPQPSEFAQLDAVADLLTREQVDSAEQLHNLQPITEPEVLKQRALLIKASLDSELSGMQASLSGIAIEDPEVQRKVSILLSDNEADMKEAGVDFKKIQFDRVVAALLTGKPPVEIETVGPYLAAHVDKETGKVEIRMENLPPDEAIGIQMAAIIRHMAEGIGSVRIVSLLDEFNNYATDRGFTDAEQDAYITAIAELYGQAGVILPEDEPGKDFILLRESDQIGKFDQLKESLLKSGRGEVVVDDAGNTYFKPNENLLSELSHQSKNRIKELRQKGILLRRGDGLPTCQALDASSYLNPRNRELMHVVMLDRSMEVQQDKTYALLRAMNIVRPDTYHNTFFDSEGLPPQVVVYAITKTIQAHVNRLLSNLEPNSYSQAA